MCGYVFGVRGRGEGGGGGGGGVEWKTHKYKKTNIRLRFKSSMSMEVSSAQEIVEDGQKQFVQFPHRASQGNYGAN